MRGIIRGFDRHTRARARGELTKKKSNQRNNRSFPTRKKDGTSPYQANYAHGENIK